MNGRFENILLFRMPCYNEKMNCKGGKTVNE